MPSVRDPNKVLSSFWMHRDIVAALEAVATANGQTKSRFIFEALIERIGVSVDENGYPVGLDLEAIKRNACVPKEQRPHSG